MITFIRTTYELLRLVLITAVLTSLLATPQGHAFTVPTLTSPVVDEAGILSNSTELRLNAELRRLKESGGSQIGVLTVKSLEGLEIEQASIKVAEAWRLGSGPKDDGIILMVAPVERRIRIEVGYGKEGDLPDALARRIIDQVIKPSFRQRDFDSGVLNGVAAIIQKTDPSFSMDQSIRPKNVRVGKIASNQFFGFVVIIMLIIWLSPVIFLFFVAKILKKMGINPEKYLSTTRGGRRVRGALYGSGIGWTSRGGGFGGGFGGWSGGGGGFGGGGSSGSW